MQNKNDKGRVIEIHNFGPLGDRGGVGSVGWKKYSMIDIFEIRMTQNQVTGERNGLVHHNPAQKGQNSQKQEQDIYHTHHMFSTSFETHASWALAHYAHHSLHSAAQMYAVPHPLTHPSTYHDCGLEILSNLFWKIDSLYTKFCGNKDL